MQSTHHTQIHFISGTYMAEVVTLLPGIQIYEKKGHMARYLLFLKIIIFIIF